MGGDEREDSPNSVLATNIPAGETKRKWRRRRQAARTGSEEVQATGDGVCLPRPNAARRALPSVGANTPLTLVAPGGQVTSAAPCARTPLSSAGCGLGVTLRCSCAAPTPGTRCVLNPLGLLNPLRTTALRVPQGSVQGAHVSQTPSRATTTSPQSPFSFGPFSPRPRLLRERSQHLVCPRSPADPELPRIAGRGTPKDLT